MDENSFEFAEIRKIKLSCTTLYETKDLLIRSEKQNLQVYAIRVRSDAAREPESLLFTDHNNKSVKSISLRTGALSTVYKSRWHVLNVYELDDKKGMLLIERNPRKKCLFSL